MMWPNSKRIETLCLLMVAIAIAFPANRAAAIPSDDLRKSLRPNGRVNDYAHLLTPEEKDSIEVRCKQLEDRTGAQLAVVTLKSLEGGQIEDFSVKLFQQWGIGQKDKKNGVLLLVSIDDRLAHIETGYGIEPIIPDILAARIIDNQLRPPFRDHQYAAGLRASVNAICELIEKGEPADREALARPDDWFMTVLFLCIFVGFGGFALGLGSGIPQIGFALFGLFFGGMATLLGYGVGGTTSLAVHVPLGILTALAGYKLAKQGGGGPHAGRRYSSSSGWNWGSFPSTSGGWSSGGWSSGGGGFSQDWGGFGGGSSGGGGATGSW